jgi:Protein of unknown function (DUF3565)
VIHILAKGRTELAHMTEVAARNPDGTLAYPPSSTIVRYRQDEEKHWIAELSCGHHQHVRHQPPLVERPWVITQSGRAEKIGHPVACAQCARERKERIRNA